MDAPISGGPHKAKSGTLTVMCGGPKEVFEQVEPVMRCMGSHVRLMGSHGSGTAAKLVGMQAPQPLLHLASQALVLAQLQYTAVLHNMLSSTLTIAAPASTARYICASVDTANMVTFVHRRYTLMQRNGHRLSSTN